PLLCEFEGKSFSWPVRSANAGFVQMPVVVAAKPLKEAQDQATILCGAIRQLMSGPVVEATGNNHVFVDVERRNDALGKHVHDVVICIGTTVEFSAERSLPFLGLQNAVRIWSMKQEALKV